MMATVLRLTILKNILENMGVLRKHILIKALVVGFTMENSVKAVIRVCKQEIFYLGTPYFKMKAERFSTVKFILILLPG